MKEGLIYTADDGTEWVITLEAPGKVLSVPPSFDHSGALLPQHELRIVFRSGDRELSQEYTAMTPLEDLSDEDLKEWYDAAREREGL